MTDQAIRVVSAGWYQDPADATRVRWWNGVTWTEHTNARPGMEAVADTAESRDVGEPQEGAAREAAEQPLTRREALAAEGGRVAPDARRSPTGVVWLIALLPIIAFVLAIAAFYVYFYVATSPLVVLVALVPYLLGLLWAVSDSRQLAARGFSAPNPLWALLTPLGYLIARRVRVPGAGPLLLFVITGILTVALPAALLVSGAGRFVTVAVQIQHAAQTQLVDTGRLASVSCPPVIESLTPGSLFTCQATSTGGTPTQVWVSIDSAAGRFSIAPAV